MVRLTKDEISASRKHNPQYLKHDSIDCQELKDYLAVAQMDDICALALEYAIMKEWSLLSVVTDEIEKRRNGLCCPW
jgi:hypothetical protein